MAIAIPIDFAREGMNPLLNPEDYPQDDLPAPMRDPYYWRSPVPGRAEEGMYFPAIAEMVGRAGPGGQAIGPGIPTQFAPPPTSQPMFPPSDYFPSIAGMVGGHDPGAIPVGPSPPVTSTDLPPIPPSVAAPAPGSPGATPEWRPPPPTAESRGLRERFYREAFGPQPGAPQREPVAVASAPSSRRFSSTRPEFIYTNPAAAQQAAANYAARLGFESQQDQGYRDYLQRLSGQQENTQLATSLADKQYAALGTEGAATRASNEKIAGMTELLRQYRLDEAKWMENERAFQLGQGYADTLNKDPNAKVNRNYVKLDPNTGKWVSAIPRTPRPSPPYLGPGFSPPQSAPAVPAPEAPPAAAAPAPAPAAPAPPASGGLHWYSFLNPLMRREVSPPREMPAVPR